MCVRQMHGVNIQPFGYQDRLDFLVSLDDAIDDINLDNIELLAVEEFLPASGPSAESLMNLFGTNSVFKSPKASSGNAPPPAGETGLYLPMLLDAKGLSYGLQKALQCCISQYSRSSIFWSEAVALSAKHGIMHACQV